MKDGTVIAVGRGGDHVPELQALFQNPVVETGKRDARLYLKQDEQVWVPLKHFYPADENNAYALVTVLKHHSSTWYELGVGKRSVEVTYEQGFGFGVEIFRVSEPTLRPLVERYAERLSELDDYPQTE